MRPTSLRPRSTSIRCSARSFSSAMSSSVIAASSSARAAAPARAGDRSQRDRAARAHAHEQLRRTADDLDAVEHEVVHVRRRIDHAERAVQVGRRKVERHVDAPRDLHLKRVARDDVLRGCARRRREICPCRSASALRPAGAVGSRSSGPSAAGPRRRATRRVDARIAPCVGRVAAPSSDAFARTRAADDDARLRAQVVEDDQRVGEHEQRVGHVDATRGRCRQPLDQARDVVAEVADGAAPELTDLRRVDRLATRSSSASRSASGSSGRRSLCQPRSGVQSSTTPSSSFHADARRGTHERVARPRLAARRADSRRKANGPSRSLANAATGVSASSRTSRQTGTSRGAVRSARDARDHETRSTLIGAGCSVLVLARRYSPIMRQILAARRAACWLFSIRRVSRASRARRRGTIR